jgi:hypothetical protein
VAARLDGVGPELEVVDLELDVVDLELDVVDLGLEVVNVGLDVDDFELEPCSDKQKCPPGGPGGHCSRELRVPRARR